MSSDHDVDHESEARRARGVAWSWCAAVPSNAGNRLRLLQLAWLAIEKHSATGAARLSRKGIEACEVVCSTNDRS